MKPEVSSSLSSSLLKKAEYDPFMQTLTIYFKNNWVYEYIEVPEDVYQNLVGASSPGKFFHKNIKSQFQFLRRK